MRVLSAAGWGPLRGGGRHTKGSVVEAPGGGEAAGPQAPARPKLLPRRLLPEPGGMSRPRAAWPVPQPRLPTARAGRALPWRSRRVAGAAGAFTPSSPRRGWRWLQTRPWPRARASPQVVL